MADYSISKDEMIVYWHRLEEQERAGLQYQMKIGPRTTMILIGALQLSMRHPDLSPGLKAKLRTVIDRLAMLFDDPVAEKMIRQGNKLP